MHNEVAFVGKERLTQCGDKHADVAEANERTPGEVAVGDYFYVINAQPTASLCHQSIAHERTLRARQE